MMLSRHAMSFALAAFALAGDWVSTPDGRRVCRLAQDLEHGMILPISFCMSWQDGFHQPIRGEQISRDYVRTRPTRDGWGTMQIHIEGKGWVP